MVIVIDADSAFHHDHTGIYVPTLDGVFYEHNNVVVIKINGELRKLVVEP
jgi:hypothetical protein